MKEDTTIAKSIMVASKGAKRTCLTKREKYDSAFKKFLSEKIILAWIMKSCVVECHDLEVRYIAEHCIEGTPEVGKIPMLPDETNMPLIEGDNTEDTSVTEGMVRYDIRFKALIPGTNTSIQLLINTECQYDYYPGYPLITRAIYYCSRMISAQYGKEFELSHYEKIKKVYSIFICSKPPKGIEHTITSYHVTEENLVGTATLNVKHYDLLTAVMVCLGDPAAADNGSVLKLLDVIASKKMNSEEKKQSLENDFQIPMTKELERQVSDMCNISQGIFEEGREEGREEGHIHDLKNLMESMNLSAREAVNILKVPKEKKAYYIELLKNQ
jgi:hypothetical protein